MNINLISAGEKDREFFKKTHHRAYRAVIESMFGWDEEKQNNYADKDFNERNPHIIQYESHRAGVLGWQEKIDHIWFGPIFILPEYQNKGIGTFLVKQFKREADSKNISLKLQTLKINEGAKRLYEGLGFKILSENEVHWQMEYTCVKK